MQSEYEQHGPPLHSLPPDATLQQPYTALPSAGTVDMLAQGMAHELQNTLIGDILDIPDILNEGHGY